MIKKATSVFVALSTSVMMLASVVAPATAGAQTVESLQAMINQLMAQINQLGGQTTSTPAASAFTRSLTIGSRGADVTQLQNFLISKGMSVPAGATGYFGAQTKAALAAYQAANGIAPAAGYFGPVTMAHVNAQLSAGTNPGTNPGTTTPSTGLQGGAGDITVTERTSGVQDEVMEGDEDVKVLGFEVEADGSDVAVTSVRVEFEHDGSGSGRLDRYVDEVNVMLGDKVVGTADVDDFNESSDVYSRNISLTGAVVDEDETGRFYVAVTAVNNVDSDDLSQDWEVALGQIRFEDATGAILTDTTGTGVNGSIAETFTFEDLSTSGDIELTVSENNDDVNEAQTIEVSDSSDTNGVEILSFKVEAEGSDISLEDITFTVTSSGAGVTEIANDFHLMKGTEEVGRYSSSTASTTAASATIEITDLDDDDVVVEEGEEVEFTLVADINDIDGGFSSGDSLSATLANANVTAEDENGDNVTNKSGSASSGPLAFASTGLTADLTKSNTSSVLNLDSTSADDQGQYVVEFTVTAFEDTAWIPLTAASSTSANSSDVGVAFGIENAQTGASVQTGTTTATLARVSGGTETGGYVRINAGQTATFSLTVYHDAATTGIYRVQMDSIGYNQSSAAAPAAEYETVPASDFESSSIQILN
ncbi:MAG TPA: peptidoglycan-binding protein [Candidatus Paceibacterota bacterium]|nr:peptidoglycan-binding protein [Candidatus Paceibacterota bacterium]